ncbi:MAG: acetyl-CoA carboxylase biotin carboxyl carrier protein [Alphaproteobacteria bacterium]
MSKDKFDLDQATIKSLAKLINKENLAEIEVGNGDDYIRVTRTVAGNVVASAPAPAPAPVATPQVTTPVTAPAENKVSGGDNPDAVKSPIVGTAYLAPSPDAEPFITVGKSVKKGDTLIIVEAMKVMNPITATKDGTVSEILVGDGEPVEFEQPLVIVS